MKLNEIEYFDCSYNHIKEVPKSEQAYYSVVPISFKDDSGFSKQFHVNFIENYTLNTSGVQCFTFSCSSSIDVLSESNTDKIFAEVKLFNGFEIGNVTELRVDKYQSCQQENFLTYNVSEKSLCKRTNECSKNRSICSELLTINSQFCQDDFIYSSDVEKSETIKIIYSLEL